MKQYNFKSDLKKILYIIGSILIIIGIFALFSIMILLPIYLLSKYNTHLYTILTLLIVSFVILTFLIIKFVRIWKRYKKTMAFLFHIMLYYFIPISIFVFFLIFEGVIFRLFFHLFYPNILIPIALIITANGIIITLLVLSRRLFFYAKRYLKEREV